MFFKCSIVASEKETGTNNCFLRFLFFKNYLFISKTEKITKKRKISLSKSLITSLGFGPSKKSEISEGDNWFWEVLKYNKHEWAQITSKQLLTSFKIKKCKRKAMSVFNKNVWLFYNLIPVHFTRLINAELNFFKITSNDFFHLVACLFSLMAGAAMPLAAFMYADFLKNSILNDEEEQKRNALMIGIMYAGLAGILFLAVWIEVRINLRITFYSVYQQKLRKIGFEPRSNIVD